MIELKKISFSLKKKILIDINFEIPRGSIFGLLGSNGSGKSTLIKIILGILSADSGKIIFDKCQINEFNRLSMLRVTGSLIEQASVYEFLSPLENLELARRLYGPTLGYSEELLAIVGLEMHIHQKVKTFSLGMKQRLGIALAMIGKPDFVVLDEPTNGLDPQGINEFGNLIVDLNRKKGVTFLISSHNLVELEKIISHFTIINNGITEYTYSINELGDQNIIDVFFGVTNKIKS